MCLPFGDLKFLVFLVLLHAVSTDVVAVCHFALALHFELLVEFFLSLVVLDATYFHAFFFKKFMLSQLPVPDDLLLDQLVLQLSLLFLLDFDLFQ